MPEALSEGESGRGEDRQCGLTPWDPAAPRGRARRRRRSSVIKLSSSVIELSPVPEITVYNRLFRVYPPSLHAGSDFWPASEHCSHCLGLPEELAVRHTALRRGYAVVAVSSYDRKGSKCWHNTQPSRSEDLRVGRAVGEWGGRVEWRGC